MTKATLMMKSVFCAGAIAACVLSGAARAQVEIVVEPPPEFIATAAPVYFEGHAAYWWNGRWVFRDRGGWRGYHDEPGFLREYRGHHEPVRQFYGRAHEGGFRRR